MNAVDFVKKFGVKEAIKVVELHPVFTLINIDGSCVSVSDLKQIVEAFELVDWHGGLKYAKSYFERNSKQYPDHYAGWSELEQAIQLVEQCQ